MPGRLRSSVYLPAPVVLAAASIIAVRLPIIEKSLFICADISHSLQLLETSWTVDPKNRCFLSFRYRKGQFQDLRVGANPAPCERMPSHRILCHMPSHIFRV